MVRFPGCLRVHAYRRRASSIGIRRVGVSFCGEVKTVSTPAMARKPLAVAEVVHDNSLCVCRQQTGRRGHLTRARTCTPSSSSAPSRETVRSTRRSAGDQRRPGTADGRGRSHDGSAMCGAISGSGTWQASRRSSWVRRTSTNRDVAATRFHARGRLNVAFRHCIGESACIAGVRQAVFSVLNDPPATGTSAATIGRPQAAASSRIFGTPSG